MNVLMEEMNRRALALNIPLGTLLASGESQRRGSGPAGKMRQLFEAASKLPRSQQEKILGILQPFIGEHGGKTV